MLAVAGCGDDGQDVADRAQRAEVRVQPAHLLGAGIDQQGIAVIVPGPFDRFAADMIGECERPARRRRLRRQVQFVAGGRAPHLQHARPAGGESHPFQVRPVAQQDMARRQRGVAAQVDLHRGREPAQVEIGADMIGRHEEGGFGQVVLPGDGLQGRVVEPVVHRDDRGRIAGEGPLGKGVHLDESQSGHAGISCRSGIEKPFAPPRPVADEQAALVEAEGAVAPEFDA